MEETLEFLILGPLEVRRGSTTLQLGSAKLRALLGVLLLHPNEAVSTARLVDELWGERREATAEKLVQGYVHALRKQLGDGVLETRAPGYRIAVGARFFGSCGVRGTDDHGSLRFSCTSPSSCASGHLHSGAARRWQTSSSKAPSGIRWRVSASSA